jgi:hypothetical protein
MIERVGHEQDLLMSFAAMTCLAMGQRWGYKFFNGLAKAGIGVRLYSFPLKQTMY